jgi:hypothetical protein
MRNNIIKKIPVLFLWMAGLAINAHAIIPHDHHQFESIADQEDTCPATTHSTNHHSGFPVHCHACNDLTSEKAVGLAVLRNIQCTNFVITPFYNFTSPELHPTGIRIIEQIRQPLRSEIPDLYLLRAPPVLG